MQIFGLIINLISRNTTSRNTSTNSSTVDITNTLTRRRYLVIKVNYRLDYKTHILKDNLVGKESSALPTMGATVLSTTIVDNTNDFRSYNIVHN